MQKGFFKKKVAMCAAMTLMGCMLLGSTAMAYTEYPYEFTVKKGATGYSGSGEKENSSQSFTIKTTSYRGKGYFFIGVYEENEQVGTDVTITGTGSFSGTYYKTAYKGRTYSLVGWYDDLQDPVSSSCYCSGKWTP